MKKNEMHKFTIHKLPKNSGSINLTVILGNNIISCVKVVVVFPDQLDLL